MLDRDTLHFKQSVSVRYAQLVYDGLWFSTLREALAGFVDETEKEVTGDVRIRLYKGSAEAVGRRSSRSLYRQDLATFGEGMAYDHKDAEGFIRLFGLPERVRALTRDRVTVDVKAVEVTRPVQRAAKGRRGSEEAGVSTGVTAPLGFRAAAVASGIKPDRLDLALLVADAPGTGGRRLHHEPRPGGAGPRLARAPEERPGAGRRRERRLRERRRPARPGSPTPARWPGSWPARSAAGPRRSSSPRPASSACGCRWRRSAPASPRPARRVSRHAGG